MTALLPRGVARISGTGVVRISGTHSKFFDSIDHGQMLAILRRQIRDERILRLIERWLEAGVLENGQWHAAEGGTPQGGSISPMLANIYLHHVLDTWVLEWRKKHARGEVIIVRYADDFILGFQYHDDATTFLEALKERLAHYALALHPAKTRLIEFGRFSARDRHRRGEGKPETFDFLGFTWMCGTTRHGRFGVRREIIKERLRCKLKAVREHLTRRMHDPVDSVGTWLGQMMTGYYAYFSVSTSAGRLNGFRTAVLRGWHHVLNRRTQRGRWNWARMLRRGSPYLPWATIKSPWPDYSPFERHLGFSRHH